MQIKKIIQKIILNYEPDHDYIIEMHTSDFFYLVYISLIKRSGWIHMTTEKNDNT